MYLASAHQQCWLCGWHGWHSLHCPSRFKMQGPTLPQLLEGRLAARLGLICLKPQSEAPRHKLPVPVCLFTLGEHGPAL